MSYKVQRLPLFIKPQHVLLLQLWPSVSTLGCDASVSSDFTHAWGDLFFGVLVESDWQVSANRSRAFSQFLWDLDLVTDTLSTDMTAPAPKPDWGFLILSSICGDENDTKKKIKIFCCFRLD